VEQDGLLGDDAKLPRSDATVTSRRSDPSMVMRPAVGSWKRASRSMVVLLPAPLDPTSATTWPRCKS
jgi:hypothetical protein